MPLSAPAVPSDPQPTLPAPASGESGNFLPDPGAALPPPLPRVAVDEGAGPPTRKTPAADAASPLPNAAVPAPEELPAQHPQDAKAPAEAHVPAPASAADPATVPAPGTLPPAAPPPLPAFEPVAGASPAMPAAAVLTPPAPPAALAAQLHAGLAPGGRSALAAGPAARALPRAGAGAGDQQSAAMAADLPAASDPAEPALTGDSAEASPASAPASSSGSAPAPAAPTAGASASPMPVPQLAAPGMPVAPAERVAEATANATAPAADQTAPGARGEAAIDQVGALREALRSARPAMTLRHAEFGTIALSIEPAAGDQWRAVLASRDPGFVPAIQAALAERALAPAAASDTGFSGQSHQHGASQNGAGEQRYGSSPNSGQGGSQPYLGQSGPGDGEAAPDHRRPSTTAALAARGANEAEDTAARAAATGGLFA